MAEPTLADLGNNLTPLVQPGKRTELAGLADISGSNVWPLIEDGSGTRWEYIGGVWYRVSSDIASLDFKGKDEKGGGGVKLTVFADKPDPKADQRRLNLPRVVGDVGPENFWDVWGSIQYGGHTHAVDGLEVLLADQRDEWANKPANEQPEELGLLCTNDGLLDDLRQFIARLGDLSGEDIGVPTAKVRLVMAVYGHGNADAIRQYRGVEQQHPTVFRCLELAPSTRPREVSNAMLTILGRPLIAA